MIVAISRISTHMRLLPSIAGLISNNKHTLMYAVHSRVGKLNLFPCCGVADLRSNQQLWSHAQGATFVKHNEPVVLDVMDIPQQCLTTQYGLSDIGCQQGKGNMWPLGRTSKNLEA
jgi:hypothetical protein